MGSSFLVRRACYTSVVKVHSGVVVSGFHSKLERDVLYILLQGKCGIIVVLARGMYRQVPKQYEEVMSQNRILFISCEKETMTRVSEVSAHRRNDYVANLADEVKAVSAY